MYFKSILYVSAHDVMYKTFKHKLNFQHLTIEICNINYLFAGLETFHNHC